MGISKTLTVTLFSLLAIWTYCNNGIETRRSSIRKMTCGNSFSLDGRTEKIPQEEDPSLLEWGFLLPVRKKKTLIGVNPYVTSDGRKKKGKYEILGRERGGLKRENKNLLEPHRYVLPFHNQEYNQKHNRFFKRPHKNRRPSWRKQGGGKKKPPRPYKTDKNLTSSQSTTSMVESTSKKNKNKTLHLNKEFRTEAVLNINYDITQMPFGVFPHRRNMKDKQTELLNELFNNVGESSTNPSSFYGKEGHGYASILKYIDNVTHSPIQHLEEVSSERDLLWKMIQEGINETESIPTEYAPEDEDVIVFVNNLECTEVNEILNQLGDYVKSSLPSNDQVDVYVKDSPARSSSEGGIWRGMKKKGSSRNSDVDECHLSFPKNSMMGKYAVTEGLVDWNMFWKGLGENPKDDSSFPLTQEPQLPGLERFDGKREDCIGDEIGANDGPQCRGLDNSLRESKQSDAHLNSCLIAAPIPKELLKGFEEAIDILRNSGKTHRLHLTTVLDGKNKEHSCQVLAESGPFKAIPALICPSSQTSALVIPVDKYHLPLFYSKDTSHVGR